MRAIVQERYGSIDDLVLREIPAPEPGPGEVLVRVRAASVHADIWHVVTGQPYVLRVMGAGVRRPWPQIPGTDMAGVVEALGPGVTRLQPGDEVFGETLSGIQWVNGGTWAELVAVPAERLGRKPAALSFVEAAAVPTSAFIALQAVRDQAHVTAGQRVLVNGAAGAVGMFAVQVARALGAHVTGVDLTAKLDVVRAIGADRVIDASAEDFTRGAEPYHVIVDVASTRTWAQCRRVLTPDGRYVLIGHDHYGATGHRWFGSLGRFAGQMLVSPFVRQLRGDQVVTPAADRLAVITAWAQSGQLRPVIDRTFPLEQAPQALHLLASGQARGRIVIQV